MKPVLHVVGFGMGDASLITPQVCEIIAQSDSVYTNERFFNKIKKWNENVYTGSISTILEEIEKKMLKNVTVVVSGDVGFYSLSSQIQRLFSKRYSILYYNGINSLQYLCARLGRAYSDIECWSLHGRVPALQAVPGVATYHAATFFLTGGLENTREALKLLAESNIPGLQVTVGEQLSGPEERIFTGSPQELLEQVQAELSVLLVDNPNPTDRFQRLRDDDFHRGRVPMTKELVRDLVAARLELKPEDLIWDVGAGTGATAIAMARKVFREGVWAVEKDELALELIRINREKLGAYNLRIVQGEAPAALADLPTPDAVFIGGSGGSLQAILRRALEQNPSVRFCLTAVTLETLQEAQEAPKQLPITDFEADCIQVSRASRAGEYHLMRGENPVYLISGRGRG